ncbi:TonB-dependent receptor [Fodinibius salsisoli]|uniref:TonB-dependent receptor n=1 Tax=Fodinibius salsisoli TaxID=2820877 RepID=A0ABT3PT35_9BACT|nr:TonB-dependent receptor [Fodinibius salsisoli]MCW9709005.1 TonB-dependent receptor [Fodinibius salsisoli]
MKKIVTLCSFIILFLVPILTLAQSSATIRGTITDTDGEPLAGANVLLVESSQGTASDAEGAYEIDNIDPGTYTLRVTFVGFQSIETAITLEAGEELNRDFTMQPGATMGEVTVTVGSRASHTAADELAVPVDVYTADDLEKTGTSEVGLMLQQVSPSVNFPRQTVADGMDALRSFTLRGLSPDHTLVLINGKRRHKSALVNRLGSGIQKGSSPVDMNAIPASAVKQMEVLRDGAAAQYGSDAIAGVVNIELIDRPVPLSLDYKIGGHATDDFSNDGTTHDINAAYGIPVGEGGYINLFGEIRFRDPTNRAGPDPRDQIVEGDADEVLDMDGDGVNEVMTKNNPIPQPNFHWGNGESNNYYLWTDAAVPVSESAEVYAFGGYSYRDALGQGFYRRGLGGRNWPDIYPQGFLPEFDIKTGDYSGSLGLRGLLGDWNYDLNIQTGGNEFEYNIDNSLNVTLGPNSPTSFYAGTVSFQQSHAMLDLSRTYDVGLAGPLNVAAGAIYRIDQYQIEAGEEASYVDGPVKENQNGGRAAPGAQVFPGFRPSQEVDENRSNVGAYIDLESDVTEQLLVNVAGRFESYSDFGETLTGKLALRFQPQEELVFRGAVSTGFRAPNLAQRYFSKISTTFIDNVPYEVGLFNNSSNVANALGVPDLKEETSFNASGGLAVSPTDNFTFTVDVFHIDIEDRIILSGNLAGEEIEALVSEFGAQRVQVFSNAIDTRTWGIDLTASYRTLIGEEGSLLLKSSFNSTRNRLVSDIRTPSQLDESFGQSIFGREARLELARERPKNTLNLEATYDKGPFSFSTITKRYGEVLVPDDAPDEDYTLGSEWIVNMSTSYDIVDNYATITVGARNLLDNYPDLTPASENFLGIFPYPTASPIGFNGRYVYSKLSITL